MVAQMTALQINGSKGLPPAFLVMVKKAAWNDGGGRVILVRGSFMHSTSTWDSGPKELNCKQQLTTPTIRKKFSIN